MYSLFQLDDGESSLNSFATVFTNVILVMGFLFILDNMK